MEVKRPVWDGNCLYDYAILEDAICPVLVLRDLNGISDVGTHQSYWKPENNLDQIIGELTYTLKRELGGMAALLRDSSGLYRGIDLLARHIRTFSLMPGNETITSETRALELIRDQHPKQIALLDDILKSIPLGKLFQYSRVEITSSEGGCFSYYVSGYPQSAEEIKRHKGFLEMEQDFPDETCFMVTVQSYLVSHKASPLSDALMSKLADYGFSRIYNHDAHEVGPGKRMPVIPGDIL